MATGEEPSESLTYKTWVLKVSIHCEGCRKKVHRILTRIPGVYDAEVDARQHKVTVKATVDAETLIWKLGKSGKYAELWPEKKPSNQNPTNGETNKKKESKETSKPGESSVDFEKKPILPESSPAKPLDATKTESSNSNSKTEENTTKEPNTPDAEETETSAKQPEKVSAAPGGGEGSADKGGGNKKKKGKKAQKEISENSVETSDAGSSNSPPPPQLQHMYTYPPYVMNYHMAQPSVSYAYYASPEPPASQGYMYTPHPPPPEFYYGPSDPSSLPPMQPPPHDNMFSDENPNACNLM